MVIKKKNILLTYYACHLNFYFSPKKYSRLKTFMFKGSGILSLFASDAASKSGAKTKIFAAEVSTGDYFRKSSA